MKTTLNRLLLFLLGLCCVSARADIILYSDSGTFTTSTPSSAFSGPGETWAFSFQADSQPTALAFGNGGVSFAFSDFTYSLDGSDVAITPSFIRFFSATNGGGFFICFDGTSVSTCNGALGTLTFGWPQMYTGPTSAPTLLPGSFTTDFAVALATGAYPQANTTILATEAPEPSTLLLLAPPFLALAGRRLRLRSRAE